MKAAGHRRKTLQLSSHGTLCMHRMRHFAGLECGEAKESEATKAWAGPRGKEGPRFGD